MAAPLSLPARAIVAGALIGFGVAGWADAGVFYHLLHWNNRVNTSTFELGQLLDNLVHASGIFTPMFGLVLASGAAQRGLRLARTVTGGAMLGAAFFRLVDSAVEHASTKLQQSRTPAEIALYDRTWTAVAVSLFLVGSLLVLLPGRPSVLRALRPTGRDAVAGQQSARPTIAALLRLAGSRLRSTSTHLRMARNQPDHRQHRARAAFKDPKSS